MSLASRAGSEFLGSAFLLMIVVGSGIMGERLSGGDLALALLANSVATGAGLFVLISSLGPISGAHFNPVVSGVDWLAGQLSRIELGAYLLAQVAGALCGVWAAHVMFGEAVIQTSNHLRNESGQWFSEAVATFGLVLAIKLLSRSNPDRTAAVVALYITSAYWFTASTSFANPAVTMARTLTDTFSGIHLSSAPGFIVFQFIGAGLALCAFLGLTWRDGTR